MERAACDEPGGEADRQQHERGDDGQAHVYLHDRFDNEICEKVRVSPGLSSTLDASATAGE
jgi:hypothetical protein